MSRALRPAAARRLSLQALIVCLGALAAAVIAFAQGSWLGVVWLLLGGLTSNLAWYYYRRSRTGSVPGQGAGQSAARTDGAATAGERETGTAPRTGTVQDG